MIQQQQQKQEEEEVVFSQRYTRFYSTWRNKKKVNTLMLSCKGESDMSRSNSGSSPVSTFPSPLFFREVNQAEMRASDFVVLNRRAADALQTHLSLPLSTRLTLYLYSHWLLLLLFSLRRHYMLAMWWLIPSWKSWPSKAHWFWFVYARACVCACVIVAKWREFLALQARPLKGKPNPGTDQSASSRWAGPQSLIPCENRNWDQPAVLFSAVPEA